MKFNVVSIVVILTMQTLFAQHETDERVIGFKYKLTFANKQPQVEVQKQNFYDPFNPRYKGDLQTPHANSICDTLGNLLFYYDGFSVYQSNGKVMQDGTLHEYNFSSYYNNTLIVPIEESNRRYYYLFETIPHQENWDYAKNTPLNCPANTYCFDFWDLCKLQYSVIDMHANGGSGRVLKKNVFIVDSVAPSISGIKHQNNIDTWVSILKFRTNKIFNYKVSSCSIQDAIISIIPDFEYKQTPFFISSYSFANQTGFQLVYSTKGDYVAFLGNKISDSNSSSSVPPPFYLFISSFNNQTGLVDFSSVQTIQVKSGYNANLFSHDSKYLYYHDSNLFAPVWIYQYELSTGTSTPFYYNNAIYHNNYTGVDYGKKNDLLIYKLNAYGSSKSYLHFYAGYLGQIKNIDKVFVPFNLVDSLPAPVYDQPKDLKGNNINYIARNNYIYNFYHPDYKKPPAFALPGAVAAPIQSPACFKNEVRFAAHSSMPADSTYWLVQQNGSSIKQKFLADTFNLSLTPGTYTVQYIAYKYCVDNTNTQTLVMEDNPQVQLAADSLYTCESKSIDLPVPKATAAYQWYNVYQEPVPLRQNSLGVYIVEAKNSCGTAADSLYVKNSALTIANLVTANNDHKNDCWQIESTNESETMEVAIYNSWGSTVFSDKHYKNNWCPADESDGIYYYDITYNNACTKKGWLQVMH